jgi:diguanylate cyclase (GGDEF)-like protein/PAS domain S-box-containing protein
MQTQSKEDLIQLVQESVQPALLAHLGDEKFISNNPQFVNLYGLKAEEIQSSILFSQILKQAKKIFQKNFNFFNFEIVDGNKIFLITAEIRDQFLLIYLQEKYSKNTPSNHLLDILDSLGAQVYCKDAEHNYTYANKKVGELFGLDNKELIGTKDADYFDEPTFNNIQSEIDDLISGKVKKIEKEESLFIKNLNEVKTFLSVKKPLHGNNKTVAMFGISTEITDYKETEKRLNAILNNLPVYIYVKDLNQRFLYANRMVQELLETSLENIINKTASEILGQEQSKECDPLDFKLIKTESIVEGFERFITEDNVFHYRSIKAPIFDEEGNLTSFIGMSTDITKSVELENSFEEANKELKIKIKEITKLKNSLWEQATHDPLTQLFNRRYFKEYLQKELSKAQRNKKPLALLLLDADYFKKINDDLGHDTGDKVLIKLSEIMMNECRRSDIICRYGGEEFVILMPEANKEAAFDRAEKIRVVYEQEISRLLNEKNTISIGIAMWHDELTNIEGFVKAADQAIYQAKENGRNQVVVYDESLNS